MSLRLTHSSVIVALAIIVLTTFASAHEVERTLTPLEHVQQASLSPAELLAQNALSVAITALLLLLAISFFAVKRNIKKQGEKVLFYRVIVAVVVLATLYVVGTTLNLNFTSTTGGPVHWHADFEIWNCNEKLDLVDPTDWSNRVGPLLTHEHNDDRMHVEGTIVNLEDASFHHFIELVGGQWTEQGMIYPTSSGNVLVPSAGSCNGEPAQLQAFRYRVSNPQQVKEWTYAQEKIPLSTLEESIAGYSNVPPGDCYIIEYGPVKEKTAHICSSYTYATQRGELHGR